MEKRRKRPFCTFKVLPVVTISWWTTRTGRFPTAHQTISNLWPPGPTQVSQAARLSPLFRPLPDTDLSRGRHQFHSESHRGRTPKAIGGSELGSSVERTYAARWKPEAVGQKICYLDSLIITLQPLVFYIVQEDGRCQTNADSFGQRSMVGVHYQNTTGDLLIGDADFTWF